MICPRSITAKRKQRHLTRNWSRWQWHTGCLTLLTSQPSLVWADHLAKGPKSADELARPTGTHAPSLYRLMRTFANLGILTEDVTHCFALTPLGETLKTSAPGSARATILTIASDWWVHGFGHLLYSVQTGKSGFEKSLGMPAFDWLANHPQEASLFSETMIGVHGSEPPAVAAVYDFSGLTTIVDVGGATR